MQVVAGRTVSSSPPPHRLGATGLVDNTILSLCVCVRAGARVQHIGHNIPLHPATELSVHKGWKIGLEEENFCVDKEL